MGGRDAKATGRPKLAKPITSELGGVAPVIVVPGPWSAADLRFQAHHVATQRLHNAGSTCIAAQMLIVSRDWDVKDAFLTELRRALASAPGRPGWYPGSADRVRLAREGHPSIAEVIEGAPGRTLLPGLDLHNSAETASPPNTSRPSSVRPSPPGIGRPFLAAAVATANDRLHGTLGANIINGRSPRSRRGSSTTKTAATTGLRLTSFAAQLRTRALWPIFASAVRG